MKCCSKKRAINENCQMENGEQKPMERNEDRMDAGKRNLMFFNVYFD